MSRTVAAETKLATIPRIAICFFGIDRSLRHTIQSIRTNIYAPAKELGEVRVYAHLFNQVIIDNPRSQEFGLTIAPAWHLLEADHIVIDEPDSFIDSATFSEVFSWGDYYLDEGKSLRNLFHQLYSLDKVYAQAAGWCPSCTLFVRPDLEYHDSLGGVMKRALASVKPAIFTPRWQQWDGGLNDRFAICSDKKSAEYYSTRYARIPKYGDRLPRGLHSELFLWEDLRLSPFIVKTIDARATRVRSNGRREIEDFTHRQKKFNAFLGLRNFRRVFAIGDPLVA